MTDELKPCPFCGDPDPFLPTELVGEKLFYIDCSNCSARVFEVTKKKVTKAWNRRADEKTKNKNRSTRIGELIAKWSKCPEDRKHIEEGRRWVMNAFYVQVTEGQSNNRATSDIDSA